MKLHYRRGACSLSPRIVPRESGLPFTPALASMKTRQLAGKPSLIGDGLAIADATVARVATWPTVQEAIKSAGLLR